MAGPDFLAAIAFYSGASAFCAGAIFVARGVLERKRFPLARPLVVVGGILIAVALAIYAHGPRAVLPF